MHDGAIVDQQGATTVCICLPPHWTRNTTPLMIDDTEKKDTHSGHLANRLQLIQVKMRRSQE